MVIASVAVEFVQFNEVIRSLFAIYSIKCTRSLFRCTSVIADIGSMLGVLIGWLRIKGALEEKPIDKSYMWEWYF